MAILLWNAQGPSAHRDNFGVGADGQLLDGLAHEAGFGQVLQLQNMHKHTHTPSDRRPAPVITNFLTLSWSISDRLFLEDQNLSLESLHQFSWVGLCNGMQSVYATCQKRKKVPHSQNVLTALGKKEKRKKKRESEREWERERERERGWTDKQRTKKSEEYYNNTTKPSSGCVSPARKMHRQNSSPQWQLPPSLPAVVTCAKHALSTPMNKTNSKHWPPKHCNRFFFLNHHPKADNSLSCGSISANPRHPQKRYSLVLACSVKMEHQKYLNSFQFENRTNWEVYACHFWPTPSYQYKKSYQGTRNNISHKGAGNEGCVCAWGCRWRCLLTGPPQVTGEHGCPQALWLLRRDWRPDQWRQRVSVLTWAPLKPETWGPHDACVCAVFSLLLTASADSFSVCCTD